MLPSNEVYVSDFMTGLIAGLAERKVQSLSLRDASLDRAFEATFKDLEKRAQPMGLVLRFRIRRHALHGDSSAVLRAVYDAAKRDLISLDNPEFVDMRLKVTNDEAARYLGALPGGRELYTWLTDRFLTHYAGPKASTHRKPRTAVARTRRQGRSDGSATPKSGRATRHPKPNSRGTSPRR